MPRAVGFSPETRSEFGRLSRFTAAGLVATATHYAVAFLAALAAGAAPQVANAAGFLVAVGVSYALQRSFTFRDRAAVRRTLPRFLLVAGLGFALSAALLQGLNAVAAPDLAALALAPLAIAAFNYLASRYWVFLR